MRSAPGLPVLFFLGALLAAGAEPGSGLVPREEPAQDAGEVQEPDSAQDAPHPGESLQVLLITLGQADYVWEQFGHNALWIRDRETGQGAAYNWGIFSFFQEGFIPRLIKGTMLYSMEPADPMALMEAARSRDRRIWIQELALTPAQKLDLLAFVQWNAQPENKEYRYDYYRDNCSTRIRDALDRVLGGRIFRATQDTITPFSYRWHTRRLLGDRPAPYLGIQFVLGLSAERPITGWEEMFLPLRLRDWVRTLEVPDEEGNLRPLLAREDAFTESQRPPPATEPPFALPWFLLAALLWGGGMLALVPVAKEGGWTRRLPLVVAAGGWALVAAVSGTLLAGAWAFTDHVFWYRNMNLLQVSPLFLPIPIPFVIFLLGRPFPVWGRDMIAALLVISFVGAAMELIPGFRQHNLEVLAFTLPMNLALWITAVRLVGPLAERQGTPEEG